MSSIGRTSIPEKHRDFWDKHYWVIFKISCNNNSLFYGLILNICNIDDYRPLDY